MTTVIELRRMIDAYRFANAEERAKLYTDIENTFSVEMATMALDMSGFTSTVKKYGIIPYLARIQSMQEIAKASFEDTGGNIVKFNADNMSAVFDSVEGAILTARTILERLKAEKTQVGAEDGVRAKIGIAWGRFLYIPDHDYFGDPVNIAYKLGEDLASAGEILVEHGCFQMLPDGHGIEHEVNDYEVGGVTIRACKITTY